MAASSAILILVAKPTQPDTAHAGFETQVRRSPAATQHRFALDGGCGDMVDSLCLSGCGVANIKSIDINQLPVELKELRTVEGIIVMPPIMLPVLHLTVGVVVEITLKVASPLNLYIGSMFVSVKQRSRGSALQRARARIGSVTLPGLV